MARQCPIYGELKLYLDCIECEDRYQCDGTAKSSKPEEKNMNRRTRICVQGQNC